MDQRLSERQRQVLLLAANGYTNMAIGRALGIHYTTAQRHLQNVYIKLGASDRAHAVAVALRLAEIDMADIHIPSTDDKDIAA